MDFVDRVVVATDSREVAEACRGVGAEVMLTRPDPPSGSDRAWEVAERVGPDFGVVVNIQGDEPLVDAEAVRGAVAMVARGFDVGTCATPVYGARELADPAAVKVARTESGRALYFSRAAIPQGRGGTGGGDPATRDRARLRHVGVYAYRREALRRWVAFPPSRREREEGLEQLRALENGMTIGVALVDEAAPGVDTPDDLERLERRMKRSRSPQ